jgi:hypothetical protein
MMWFLVVACITVLIVCLVYVAQMEDILYREPDIPEFDSERKVREIKLRLADIQWHRNKTKQ